MRAKTDTMRDRLADEIAGLRAEIKALRSERDQTAQLKALNAEIEQAKMEKARIDEEHKRRIRETEHKVGLLKVQQDHEVANARRETELAVREENLAAEKQRFADEMTFQREHLQREVDRIDGILGKVLERLPNIDAALSGSIGQDARTSVQKDAM